MTQRTFQIIYADPPWRYNDTKSCDPRMGGITYPTMSSAELAALPVERLAADDCALFLWATMPMLREAFQLIAAWKFRYITCAFTWVKQNPSGHGIYSGLGHWTNANAELCLFSKKGAPRRIQRNVKQIVIAPRTRHSEKPAIVRERIVRLLGDRPRIELFARRKTPGWAAWGNEIDSDIRWPA